MALNDRPHSGRRGFSAANRKVGNTACVNVDLAAAQAGTKHAVGGQKSQNQLLEDAERMKHRLFWTWIATSCPALELLLRHPRPPRSTAVTGRRPAAGLHAAQGHRRLRRPPWKNRPALPTLRAQSAAASPGKEDSNGDALTDPENDENDGMSAADKGFASEPRPQPLPPFPALLAAGGPGKSHRHPRRGLCPDPRRGPGERPQAAPGKRGPEVHHIQTHPRNLLLPPGGGQRQTQFHPHHHQPARAGGNRLFHHRPRAGFFPRVLSPVRKIPPHDRRRPSRRPVCRPNCPGCR